MTELSWVAWKGWAKYSMGHLPRTERPSHGLVIWRALCGQELPLNGQVYRGPDRCKRCQAELLRKGSP